MGHISSQYVLGRLAEVGRSAGESILFKEADPVSIQATARRGRRREKAERLDLLATDRTTGEPLFWTEVKTGPGSATQMSAFQLDCSDCDDITNTMETSGLPAILVHCQIAKVPQPPTMRLVGNDAWWTDIFDFAEAFRQTAPRRGNERKLAAYFSISCFRPMGDLVGYLVNKQYRSDLARLRRDGVPVLYQQA
jgi:hypothetical protein